MVWLGHGLGSAKPQAAFDYASRFNRIGSFRYLEPTIAIRSKTIKPADAASYEAARKLAIDAARMAKNTRCHGVVVLDVRGLSPITDFFVIATGTSARQMKSVADDIMEMAAEREEHAMSSKGLESESWILVDFVDVVVHIFSQDARLFYDLENLWGDARPVEWEEPVAPK